MPRHHCRRNRKSQLHFQCIQCVLQKLRKTIIADFFIDSTSIDNNKNKIQNHDGGWQEKYVQIICLMILIDLIFDETTESSMFG